MVQWAHQNFNSPQTNEKRHGTHARISFTNDPNEFFYAYQLIDKIFSIIKDANKNKGLSLDFGLAVNSQEIAMINMLKKRITEDEDY